jgi:hypothetical protein
VNEGAFAGTEALLVLKPIQRAQPKSKQPELATENILLSGLYTTHQEQHLRLKLSVSFLRLSRDGAGAIPLSKSGETYDRRLF